MQLLIDWNKIFKCFVILLLFPYPRRSQIYNIKLKLGQSFNDTLMEKGNSVPEFVKIKSSDLLTCLHC